MAAELGGQQEGRSRRDRLLRLVIPMDAVASYAFVALALLAAPALVLLHPSSGVVEAIGFAFIAYGVALAAMGAVTACALLSGMAHGRLELPARLWLPLPRAFQRSAGLPGAADGSSDGSGATGELSSPAGGR